MEAFFNTEVVAGIILGFYFIVKGISSFKNKDNSGQKSVVVYQANQEHQQILSELKDLRARIEEWDDMIRHGEFSSPWTEREVQIVLDRLDRLITALIK